MSCHLFCWISVKLIDSPRASKLSNGWMQMRMRHCETWHFNLAWSSVKGTGRFSLKMSKICSLCSDWHWAGVGDSKPVCVCTAQTGGFVLWKWVAARQFSPWPIALPVVAGNQEPTCVQVRLLIRHSFIDSSNKYVSSTCLAQGVLLDT